MNECGYAYDDDFYNSVSCDLPALHEGPHRASYQWETRAADICREQGHEWGDWEPYPSKPSGQPWHFTPAAIKQPTQQRYCKRCERREDNGEWPAQGIYPVLTPMRNFIRMGKAHQ